MKGQIGPKTMNLLQAAREIGIERLVHTSTSEVYGKASASTFSEGDDLLISVSDNGVGLSVHDRQRIFRQFYRVDQRLARTQEGLGLGLSIVKRLLESMEGRIEVSSDEGKGSQFTIHIPQVK